METPLTPYVDEKVVTYLESRFPDHLPSSLRTTDREMVSMIGQQEVIRHLRFLVNQQNAHRTIVVDAISHHLENS